MNIQLVHTLIMATIGVVAMAQAMRIVQKNGRQALMLFAFSTGAVLSSVGHLNQYLFPTGQGVLIQEVGEVLFIIAAVVTVKGIVTN